MGKWVFSLTKFFIIDKKTFFVNFIYSRLYYCVMRSEIEKLAKLITEYSVNVGKGDKVLIDGDPTGTPLIHLGLHQEILKRGGVPFHKSTLGDQDYLNWEYADEFQYRTFAEDDKRILENTDILIGIEGSTNPRRIDRVTTPKKVEKFHKATGFVKDYTIKKYNAGKLHLFYLDYPSNGMAQKVGMSLMEYENLFKN